jgi:hypothetical protein
VRLFNIQENLSKTEIIQRLQQIMQDAARASQDVQTPQSLERSRVAQEQVENTQESKHEGIHKDGARRKARPRKKKGGTGSGQDVATEEVEDRSDRPRRGRRPNDGHLLDITV